MSPPLDPRELAWAKAALEGDALVFATGVVGFLMPGLPNPNNEPQLEAWQVEGLDRFSKAWRERFKKPGRLSIRSGHGVGKTTFLCICILFVLLCGGPDCKIPVVANSQDQLRVGLWPELLKWMNRLPAKLRAELDWQKERVNVKCAPEEAFAVARTASKHRPEALQGIHARTILAVFEEASGIPDETIEASAGALSTPGAMAIAAGNPTRANGFFHMTHTALRDIWDCLHVNSESVARARGHINDIVRLYGRDSNKYRVRVLGEFPTRDDDTVIPLELALAAQGRKVHPLDVLPIWGLDVARFGDDATALIKRQGNVLLEPPIVWKNLDTVQIAGRIMAEYHKTWPAMRPSEIMIDVIGFGAGVVDVLRKVNNLPIARGINVAENSSVSDQYHRLRDELWWKGRQWFEEAACSIPAEGCERLVTQLTTPTYDHSVAGKIVVESKDDFKKRLGHSPDEADALLLTFAATPRPRPKDHGRGDNERAGRGSGWTG